MLWTDRVRTAARSGLPYIDNETSYKQLSTGYGFEFDDNLTPIRGKDRNYAVGPLAAGWWCFYYPSHAERFGRPHHFSAWGDRIVAALQKGRTSGYGGGFLPEISYTMNLLPFLLDGAQAVAEQLRLLNPASHAGIAEHWVKVFRPAYGQIKKIVCWDPDGTFRGAIEPNFAVKALEEAFEIVGISTAPAATQEGKPMMMTEAERRAMAETAGESDKGPQDKPIARAKIIDLGASATFWQTGTTKNGHLIYDVAPAAEAVQEWGIPDDAVTLLVRTDNGTGRMRIFEGEKTDLDASKVRAMDGKIMRFHGHESKFKWKQRARRAVANLTAEQIEAIIGE